MHPTGQFKLLPAFQFMNMDWKGQVSGDTAQSLDDVGSAGWPVDVERLCSFRVRHHEEHARQTRDMVRVHVRKANSPELPEAPSKGLPWDLGSFATIEERQGRPAAHQRARKPATGHGHHAIRSQQTNVDHPTSLPLKNSTLAYCTF